MTDPYSDDRAHRLNRRFASVQYVGTSLALVLIVSSYVIYVTGLLPPLVPLADLPHLIDGGADAFAAANDLPRGWSWLGFLHHGDMLALGGLLVPVFVIAAAYLGLIRELVRQRDFVYLSLIVLQLGMLVLAAAVGPSGGGH